MAEEYFPEALPPDIEEFIDRAERQLWAAEQLTDEDSETSQRFKRSYEEGVAENNSGRTLRGWEELGREPS